MSHTTSKITLAGVLALPVLVFVLTGCTGSQPPQVLPSGSDAPVPAELEDHYADGHTHAADDHTETGNDEVLTVGLKYMPADITVQVGDTVTWTNGEAIGHTITSGDWGEVDAATGLRGTQTPDGLFDHDLSPKGEDGDTFSFTFTEAGVYEYYCSPHLTMNATVTVEP